MGENKLTPISPVFILLFMPTVFICDLIVDYVIACKKRAH